MVHHNIFHLRRSLSSESILIKRCRSDEREDLRLSEPERNNAKKSYGGAQRNNGFDNDSGSSNYSGGDDDGEQNLCSCIPGSGQTCNKCYSRFNNDNTGGGGVSGQVRRSNRHLSITVMDSGEHCHDDEIQREIDKKARKKLWMASGLCVVFMIAEAIGGALAGSLAVATDAAHLLTDFAGFMISLFALYISERPATTRLSYGYHRAEVIGALTSVLLIWVVTGILVFMATQRLILKEFEIDAPIMLITSGVGLIVNIIMGCTLHQHAHSHGGGGSSSHGHSHNPPSGSSSHGHNHQAHGTSGNNHKHKSGTTTTTSPHEITIMTDETMTSYQNGLIGLNPNNPTTTAPVANLDIEAGEGDENEINNGGNNSCTSSVSSSSPPTISSSDGSHVALHKHNVNVRAAFIHVVGDFIQSVGVFGAAIVIYFKPTWVIVDPICTYLFSVLVLATTYAIVKETVFVLMEGIPKGIDFNDVRETLLHVKGVCKVHNLRIWSLSMDRIALSAHLAIDPAGTRNSNDILRKSSQLVKVKYGFSEVTIQIEDFSEKMQDCRKCNELN